MSVDFSSFCDQKGVMATLTRRSISTVIYSSSFPVESPREAILDLETSLRR